MEHISKITLRKNLGVQIMKKIASLLLVLASTFIASCTTQQATQIDGDIYTGNETIKYLADGAFKKVERYAFSFAAFSSAFSDIAVQE